MSLRFYQKSKFREQITFTQILKNISHVLLPPCERWTIYIIYFVVWFFNYRWSGVFEQKGRIIYRGQNERINKIQRIPGKIVISSLVLHFSEKTIDILTFRYHSSTLKSHKFFKSTHKKTIIFTLNTVNFIDWCLTELEYRQPWY